MKRKIMMCVLLVVFFFLGSSIAMFGQAVSGTLVGTVQDSSGAAVVKASVTATEVGTDTTYQSVTNETGNYTIPSLPPGRYTVTVSAAGFKKWTHENIDVLLNSTTRVDAEVVPGSVTEEVLVTAVPPLLQTDRADISTKLETHDIANLPLSTNRNFQSLLNLVPGTSPATFQHSQFFNAQSSLQTQVNGMPRQSNLYQIEGIDDDERTGLLQIIIPSAEAIQSVDISTNNFDAELGRAMGGVTNVVLKSGTNAIHGSVFYFIQNSAVNARSYFSGPLGHLAYNNVGGAIGGPILKDKLFFFGDYTHTSDHEAIASTFTIPDSRYYTPNAQGNIDLSSTLGAINSHGFRAGQVFDPATGNGLSASTPGGTPRTPFANNQIPFSRVNPVSLAILQKVNAAAAQYGKLNTTLPLSRPTNNYTTNLPFTKSTDSFDTKIDFTLNERNHVSGRYSYQRVNTFQAPAFGSFLGGPAGGGFQGTGAQNSYSFGVNYDHAFSPTLFTEVRFGVAHLHNDAQPSGYGSNDATTLGIPGVNINQFTSGQVGIFFGTNGFFGQSGQNYPLIGYSASVPWIRGESNIDFVNNWTKIIRNHTVKVGVDLRRVRDDLLQDQTFSPRGAFTFSDVQTSDSLGTTNVANYISSFLLDLPSQVGRDLNTYFPAYRQWWFFAFASDKWQATSRLTVDLGVRWDFYPPATPRRAGGFSNYDPVANQLVIAGVGGNPSNLGMQTRYRYFAPRTGFSYRATDDTVIRGGFGISYTPFPDNVYAYNYPVRANNSYGLVGSSPFTAAVLADGVTVATFQAGFPAPVPVPIPANGIIPANTPQLRSQAYFYIPSTYKNPYVMSWNVAVQQAFRGNVSMQVAYVANHGVDISGAQNINLPSTYGGGAASSPENIAFGRTAATNQYYLPFSSNYQSLQAQLNKRFSNGLAFTSAFTWGKAMGYIANTGPAGSPDNGGLLFFIGGRRNYAPLDFDRTLNYEQSFTYELPFGPGHTMFSSGFASYALGGWKIAGIVSVVSGLPFTVATNGANLNTPGTMQTGNLTGAYRASHAVGSANHWFDPTAFSVPSGCPSSGCTAQNVGVGNTGRNQFRGPGYIGDSISIFRDFPLFREASGEFRFDAFQLSNTPQFANPTSNNCCATTNSSFGTVTTTLGSGQGSVNGVGGGRNLQLSARINF